nr:YhfC family intramembrane metalloprotease [Eubacterium sp.]
MNSLLVATRFSSSTLTTMIVVALVCTAVPFLLLAYYRVKTSAKISSFFVGMGFYALFYFVAQGLLNAFLFNVCNLKDVFNMSTHPIWYTLYGALVAGIFGFMGKYIGLRFAMKTRTGKDNGLVFGAGYGGFETIAFGSSMIMGNVILAFMVNSLGMDEYIAKLGLTGKELTEFQNGLQQLMAVPAMEYVSQGIEQMLTLFFQTALAILLYLGIHGQNEKRLFPICVVLEILYYVPVYLTRAGIIENPMINLGIAGAIAVLTAAYAYRRFFLTPEEV